MHQEPRPAKIGESPFGRTTKAHQTQLMARHEKKCLLLMRHDTQLVRSRLLAPPDPPLVG
jgi:hypothetical protein